MEILTARVIYSTTRVSTVGGPEVKPQHDLTEVEETALQSQQKPGARSTRTGRREEGDGLSTGCHATVAAEEAHGKVRETQ